MDRKLSAKLLSFLLIFVLPLLVLSQDEPKPEQKSEQPPERQYFYLKIDGDYVAGYHTGAGLGDAVLVSDVGNARRAYLEDTRVQFEYDTPFPWGLRLASSPRYSGRIGPSTLPLMALRLIPVHVPWFC